MARNRPPDPLGLPALHRPPHLARPTRRGGYGLFALGGLLFSEGGFHLHRHIEWFEAFFAITAVGFATIAIVLFTTRAWSFWVACAFGGIFALGRGAWTEVPTGQTVVESVKALRGLEFVRPWWLVLLVFVPVVVVLGRRSLSGLGPVRKWLAISARVLIVTALTLACAEPRIKRQSDNLTVLFVIDRSYSVPQESDPADPANPNAPIVDRRWNRLKDFVDDAVRSRGPSHRNDQSGVILFGRRPKLVLPPASVDGKMVIDELAAGPIDGTYTDIAAALKLAIASFPEGTAKRIVLVSDGNENVGSAMEQANVARQNGVQIDTVALAVGAKKTDEVRIVSVEAPPNTQAGARLPLRVIVRNEHPNRVVDGLLELVQIRTDRGQQIERQVDIEVDGDTRDRVLDKSKLPARVRLYPGSNVFRFRDRAESRGESSYSYRATFVPVRSADESGLNVVEGLPGDRPTNNRASTTVVARGQRRVLFLEDVPGQARSAHTHLYDALRRANFRMDFVPIANLPPDRDDLALFLTNYDCVIFANVPAETMSTDQMEAIRTTVHDQGCGLVMVGGPDSFGPGGYQSTPIEQALPVDCEIKAVKAVGKGGLIMIMHASEMDRGNYWQKQVAKLAIQRLGAVDMVGVAQYGFGAGGGVSWVIPFQPVGEDKSNLLAKIDRMTPGDMPDFDPFLVAAVDTLTDDQYQLAVKHCIIISDGDPIYGVRGQAAVKRMADNAVSCTTVGVATHGAAENAKMKAIAEATKDGAGRPGKYYEPKNGAELPAIYIKESRRISQSFIFDRRFTPTMRLRSGPADTLPLAGLPDLYGFVRTTKKSSPLAETHVDGPRLPDQEFPIVASWRYGLGKAVAHTADARTIPEKGIKGWDRDWASSDLYQKYWEQVVNWAMREAERGKLAIQTEWRDGKMRIIVDARDEKDKAVGGLRLKAAITSPKPPAPGEKPIEPEFKREGVGRYVAEVTAEEAGSYFLNVVASQAGPNGTFVPFDAARAGFAVPYSPEYADLESNPKLLRQISELTDGNVFSDSDDLGQIAKDKTLFRDAPKTVRSLLPFWFWLVFAAGIVLVFDVGVRRVSLEWTEVRSKAEQIWIQLRTKPTLETESTGLNQLLRRKQTVGEAIDKSRAARKFDPTGAPVETSETPKAADDFVTKGPPLLPPPPPRPTEPKPAQDDFFTRMQKAKKRAGQQPGGDQP
ncbi:MAG: VWA domain-containing protein [Gemmataceae bacterium]